MSERKNSRFEKYKTCLEKSSLLSAPLRMENEENCMWEEQGTGMPVEDIAAQVSTCVLAPALNSYVIWVLWNARKKGIRRLYFLARDGYLMYRTAEIFCRRLHLPVECRYLHCSRYSLRVPVYHLNTDDALEYICRGGIDVTMKKILGRSGITEEEQKTVLKQLALAFSETEVIPYAKLEGIRERLKQNPYFLECLCRHSREALPGLQGYLTQEGLLEDVPDAIVDSGWIGSMQKTLNQVLEHFGRIRALEGYYWGLYELPSGVERELYHCYYFYPDRCLREKVYFSNCLFEAIFSAPHGMTMGYEEKEGGFEPYFSACGESRKQFIEMTETYLRQYTERLAEAVPYQKIDWKRDRAIVRKLLKMFMGKPVKEEAEVYGALRFTDDVLDIDTQQAAAVLTEEEFKANHVWNKALTMLGIRHGYIRESAWYEGSAARCGKHVRYHRGQYVIYKYLLYVRKILQEQRKMRKKYLNEVSSGKLRNK